MQMKGVIYVICGFGKNKPSSASTGVGWRAGRRGVRAPNLWVRLANKG